MAPYALMRDELRKQKRDIVYSLCQYGDNRVWEWGADVDGQLWRTTGDITDTWGSMSGIGFSQDKTAPYAKPGHWNDPDMLVVGHVGWGPNVRPTRLTPDEQYTHMTLWSLLSAPLLIGCDLTKLDEFTLSLLTNDEVIDINQDRLGKQAVKVAGSDKQPVYLKQLADGSVAIGLFNRDMEEATIEVDLNELKLDGTYRVRNVWAQKDEESVSMAINETIPPHGAKLFRLTKAK
jgi:alpha-galactosidase